MKKRQYVQRARAVAAEQTRRDLLDALERQLRESPTTSISLDAVARLAGVARSTVYAVFGSRAGFFTAFGEDLLNRGGFDEVVAATAMPDARASMRAGIRATVSLYAAERDVLRALHSMALLDPDAYAGAVHPIEENRAGGMVHLARRLAAAGELRDDTNEQEAADLLWLVTGFDAFDVLYTQRGVPSEEISDRLLSMTERTLCG